MLTTSATRSGNNVVPARSRSFGGCHTCRKRHVKCDERQPACRQCDRFGIPCGGYVKNIIFDFELNSSVGSGQDGSSSSSNCNAPIDTATRFRRPLLTEEERCRMSEWLITAVSPRATARVLRELDDESEAMLTDDSHHLELVRGPFGAFKVITKHEEVEAESPSDLNVHASEGASVSASLSASAPACASDLDHEFSRHPSGGDGGQLLLNGIEEEFTQSQYNWISPNWLQATPTPATMVGACQSSSAERDPTDQDHAAPTLGLYGESLAEHMVSSALDQDESATLIRSIDIMSGLENPWDSEMLPGALDFGMAELLAMQHNLYSPAARIQTSQLDFMNSHQNPLLAQAVPLLKYYTATIIATMTPFQHHNTPWHILFLGQLKTCLATLTLRETLDEAGLTTFYGSLAVSALSLGTAMQSSVWIDRAILYQQQSCIYARALFTKSCKSMDPDEYRSALIALLTVAQMSVFLGDREQTEGFLLETEKLIRLCGLSRRKSRKIRLLHHCYVYMRLLHESTFIMAGVHESSHRRQVRNAVESSGVAGSADNLSFRLLHSADFVREMTILKDQARGENDLHIAIPGVFPSTMYPEIFGIPEMFLFLLSQTIRLANEKELAEREDESHPISLREFVRRAKAIEQGINQLQDRKPTAHTSDAHVLPIMVDGLQQALAIYFYRRIYDVSTSMLQSRVVSVRNWLFKYEQANPKILHGFFGLVWPAFIAACEADGAELQGSFRQWFRTATQRSGLVCFKENLNVIEKVWHTRGSADTETVTWLEIVKREGIRIQGPGQTVL